ncbi:MAG TPA: hypothetical protein VI685_00855 [Candidatus Angelobacter sp.]
MSIPSSFFSAVHADDPYATSHAGERALNRAIVTAEISRSFEEYLEIFNRFYAEDIEVSSATTGQIRGKAKVGSLLYDVLVPLHVMVEVGGVSISIRQITMPGDVADETNSAWTLELVGATGRTCTISWRTLRRWKDSLVIYEHHYDQQQSGGPLTEDDLSFGAAQNPISQHAGLSPESSWFQRGAHPFSDHER